MKTFVMWEETNKKKEPFELRDTEFDCCRIEKGDSFEIYQDEENGDTVMYTLIVASVQYHFVNDSNNGIYQYVFLKK